MPNDTNKTQKPAQPGPTAKTAALTIRKRIMATGAAVMLVIAAMILMRDPSRRASVAVDAKTATPESLATETTSPELQPSAESAARQVAAAKPKPATPHRSTNAATLEPAPVPNRTVTGEPATKTASAEPRANAVATAVTASAAASNEDAVTLTGCLEATVDGEEFRLTDTEGTSAPQSRGWRSGFLKKRPAPVQLVGLQDKTAALKLVGHRVVTTGLLDSRELNVRSITSAGQKCD